MDKLPYFLVLVRILATEPVTIGNLFFKIPALVWHRIPVLLALRKPKHMNATKSGNLELHSELEANLGYTVRACLENNKQINTNINTCLFSILSHSTHAGRHTIMTGAIPFINLEDTQMTVT